MSDPFETQIENASESRSGSSNRASRSWLWRAVAVVLVLVLVLLWYAFPRLVVSREKIELATGQSELVVAYRFQDPLSVIRSYLAGDPEIARFLIQPDETAIDVGASRNAEGRVIVVSRNQSMCAGMSGNLEIYHTGRNSPKSLLFEVHPDASGQSRMDVRIESPPTFRRNVFPDALAHRVPITLVDAGDCRNASPEVTRSMQLKLGNDTAFSAAIDSDGINLQLKSTKPGVFSEVATLDLNGHPLASLDLRAIVAPTETILFALDDDNPLGIDTASIDVHRAFLQALAGSMNLYVEIRGHADYRGTVNHNYGLSLRRAERTEKLLGVDARGLRFGECVPLVGSEGVCLAGEDSDCETARVARDRRVDVSYSIGAGEDHSETTGLCP